MERYYAWEGLKAARASQVALLLWLFTRIPLLFVFGLLMYCLTFGWMICWKRVQNHAT